MGRGGIDRGMKRENIFNKKDVECFAQIVLGRKEGRILAKELTSKNKQQGAKKKTKKSKKQL